MSAGRAARLRRCCRVAATLLLGIALAGAVPHLPAQSPSSPRYYMLDRFDNLVAWKAAGSDNVKAAIRPNAGVGGGRALRLDFDLAGTAGFALAGRALPIDVPPNYEFGFWLRGEAHTNDLQVKFVDDSGDNVWWFHRRNYEFPTEWHFVRIKKRQIEFAWGPIQDHELRHVARIEIVVAAGRGGGAGWIEISDLVMREILPQPSNWPLPQVSASSQLPGADAANAVDGKPATAWRSDPATGAAQTLTLDFGRVREFGGVVVRWQGGAYASRYQVQLSDDGDRWQTVRSVNGGRGGPDALMLADGESRYLRLKMDAGPATNYGVAEIEIRDPSFGAAPNAFFQGLARDWPRGYFPRGVSGEQGYWTVVGIDGGSDNGLLSEDGALEVASGGFSIEPFVVAGSRVTTWADVTEKQSLRDGYLPIPSVAWEHNDWQLRITAFAAGSRASTRLVARYELRNVSDHAISLRLVLGLRPFQVNPPAQALNVEGGVSPVRAIGWDGTALTVNSERKVYPLQPPQRVGLAQFDAGPVPAWAQAEDWPGGRDLRDAFGYASAAIGYEVMLGPGAMTTLGVVVPLAGEAAAPALERESPAAWMAREEETVANTWREKQNRVAFDVPPAAQPLIDTMRTALAHILVIRDGPILRPGTRSYARSWIRDGAMMSESLLRLGHADAAIDYLRWFAPYQFPDGKIPCCVDPRGADPVAENDSDGEFVFLVDEVHRYTHDPAVLASMWPHVEGAMRHLESMRTAGADLANLAPDRIALYGLLPASISHEGYSAKPMHSYWDDFWGAKGYAAAVDLAAARGATDEAAQWRAAGSAFGRDILASIEASSSAHTIDYIPGAAELGDFDATSTAIAFTPGATLLDAGAKNVQSTFEWYWRKFVARRDGRMAWSDYTPYEIRTVGTFVRLGWQERAQELLSFFMADRRPTAWNQWAEVVGRNYREPRFIGDMPHGWVASDFVRAVLDLFAYERDADGAVVLARGVPPAWQEGKGIAVRSLRTPYGTLSYSLAKKGRRTTLRIDAQSALPPGGFVIVAPPGKPVPSATINGKPASWRGMELRVAELPATVVVNER